MDQTNTPHLPTQPGVARRNAYGEYVRLRNQSTHRNRGLFFTSRIRRNITALPFGTRGGMYGMRPGTPSSDHERLTYENLVQLQDVEPGLLLKNLIAGSKLRVSDTSTFCVVCQDHTNKFTDVIRILSCSHVFHADCIDKWFLKKSTCPICKTCLRQN